MKCQAEKLKKQIDESSNKNETISSEVSRLKREFDSVNKHFKQTESDIQGKDVRYITFKSSLNRALEEIEKYKNMLSVRGSDTKEQLETARRTADQLFAENKKLQKQKGDVMLAFKKQGQLIEILKRQKLHIQSARLLEFTEEEFMRALNMDV